MKNRILSAILLVGIMFGIVFQLQGCNQDISSENLMKDVIAHENKDTEKGIDRTDTSHLTTEEISVKITDFGIRLFQQKFNVKENRSLSPISVLSALSMTANGAKEETLAQMQDTFGLSIEQLNLYFKEYMRHLSQTDTYKLYLANSIWVTTHNRFKVNEDFLQTNADYYQSDIYAAAFDDATCSDINQWVKDKTDGMISDVLDEIPYETVMYLINALAFDAKWEKEYETYQVNDENFTTQAGQKQEVEMMHSEESVYLEDENATGYIKYYKDKKYAFVGLLPKEHLTLEEYVLSLTGESIQRLLNQSQETTVYTGIPKFESEYSIEMKEILTTMGMTDVFDDEKADLSGIGVSDAGKLFINRVLHKTYISVAEQGTKAGAVTIVEVNDCAGVLMEEPKNVILNRPFVYMLIDCETNQPFFIGNVSDFSKIIE